MAIQRNTTGEIITITEDQFMDDVLNGLSASPKYLSSKYFYDKKGDALFVEITKLPEYYLTRSEEEIIEQSGEEISSVLGIGADVCKVIELGPGNGRKAINLLRWARNNESLTFIPIDISSNTLEKVIENFYNDLPEVNIEAKSGEYFDALSEVVGDEKKIILFLGSNIGNMTDEEAHGFVQQLSDNMDHRDQMVLGVDLKKNSGIILPAYDDAQGVTKAFNLNLLDRINRELGGNFNLDQFDHIAEYDEDKGEARSYLKSKIDQSVEISALNQSFEFKANETIHTEISQKYDDGKLDALIEETDLVVKRKFTDGKAYFAEYILQKT